MTRILIAGFQHETNTFGATKATMADFELADSWPGLLRGEEVITGSEGTSLPLAGFVRQARQDPGVELIPVIWCSAEPSAHVTDDAFEQITSMILDAVNAAGPLDGIYLDLHGAMVTESHEDGEGEILRRLRALTGPDLPISVSLDLHANLTRMMVEHASAITIFRTYPHLDMAETGGRAFHTLRHLIAGGTVHAAYRQVPFLVPLHAQFTGAAPLNALYDQVAAYGSAPDCWAELAAGFPAADIHDAGPAILAYADSQDRADAIADELLVEFVAAEAVFDCSLLQADEAVAKAMALADGSSRPVVIADVQDNPGAGGTSDTTGLLRALVNGGAKRAVLGMLCDPEMAEKAHVAGVGSVIEGTLGGKVGPEPAPYSGRFRVERLSNGRFAFGGEMYAGGHAETGPTALLRIADDRSDVSIAVSSVRCQCLDRAIFTHLGVDLENQHIIAVKSTVHFRADFEPIASAVLNAAAPGLFPCRLEEVSYTNLRRGVRVSPLGAAHQ
jgi:microcystin degradation protein MlrC